MSAQVSPIHRRISRRHAITLGAAGGVALSAMLAAPALPLPALAPAARAQAPLKVRMSVLPIFISAPMFIAQEKGYFTQAGIELETSQLWVSSDLIAAFASKSIDGAAAGFGPAQMNAVNQGVLDVRLIAPLHSERPPLATPLVVRKPLWDDGSVRSVADLKGRKVAINSKGSAVEYWFYAALATGGLTPNDVDVVVLPFQDAIVAMTNGAIDGALIGEPDVTRAELDGGIVRLTEDFVDDIQVTALYFDTTFLTDHRPEMEQFLAAYLHGARDLAGAGYRDPTNIEILSKYTKTPANVLAVARTPYHDPDGNVHVQDFEKLQEFFVAQGVVKTPIDINAVVDPSFAEAARQILANGQ
jgi:NitT/TauT family transport system substrate-binding protein